MSSLEKYFQRFRRNTIGHDLVHTFPWGKQNILYADWAASGRLYRPIEEFISNQLGPYVANTHTETNLTGSLMTATYHQAQKIIKKHVGADNNDILLFSGFGMTAVVNKFQRILGLRAPEQLQKKLKLEASERPLVIITHMEHHSNQTTWQECMVDVEIIRRSDDGLPDLNHLEEILKNNTNRKLKIGSFSACSNVTGIITPYHKMAKIMHAYGGLCFIDFSASAPYVNMNMHPEQEDEKLDAIYFSPHKFLGGPGASGVIVFDKSLHKNIVPDHPGGGTVSWTNPWGGHKFHSDIEVREDGGTPGFLQGIKAALAILLKDEMGVFNILKRETELKQRLLLKLKQHPFITILDEQQVHRLGFVSFFSKHIHHNLFVKLLNDKFGVQARGGCSCAGTYGHILLNVTQETSHQITEQIDSGDLSAKPGWVRVSIHPIMTDAEIDSIADSISQVISNYKEWALEYKFDKATAEFSSSLYPETPPSLLQTFTQFHKDFS